MGSIVNFGIPPTADEETLAILRRTQDNLMVLNFRELEEDAQLNSIQEAGKLMKRADVLYTDKQRLKNFVSVYDADDQPESIRSAVQEILKAWDEPGW